MAQGPELHASRCRTSVGFRTSELGRTSDVLRTSEVGVLTSCCRGLGRVGAGTSDVRWVSDVRGVGRPKYVGRPMHLQSLCHEFGRPARQTRRTSESRRTSEAWSCFFSFPSSLPSFPRGRCSRSLASNLLHDARVALQPEYAWEWGVK